MKFTQTLLLTLFLSAALPLNSQAANQGVNGLVIGAGSGAILGQALGRDTESTLIGTAVGSMLGYMIANESTPKGYTNVYHRQQPPIYHPPHRHYPRPSTHRVKEKSRKYYRGNKICRETIKFQTFNGKHKRVVSTTCWRNKDFRTRGRSYRHRDNTHHRDSYRHDEHWNRWHR